MPADAARPGVRSWDLPSQPAASAAAQASASAGRVQAEPPTCLPRRRAARASAPFQNAALGQPGAPALLHQPGESLPGQRPGFSPPGWGAELRGWGWAVMFTQLKSRNNVFKTGRQQRWVRGRVLDGACQSSHCFLRGKEPRMRLLNI